MFRVSPRGGQQAHTVFVGIFTIKRKRRRSLGNLYQLQQEKSGKPLFGFSHGSTDFVQLSDKDGGQWRGSEVETDDTGTRFRFGNDKGDTLSGVANGNAIILRDSKGRVWKGIID